MKRISKEISNQVDDLLSNAESPIDLDEAIAVINTEKSNTNSNLPDIKTLLQTKVPTIRYHLINMRYKWSEFFSGVNTDCIEDIKLKLNWRKSFGLAKCILRASNRGGRKHRCNNDQKILKRINRWNSGGFGGLWNEACSMKQSKRSNDNNFEEIITRAKTLCLHSQYGRAAKILASGKWSLFSSHTFPRGTHFPHAQKWSTILENKFC